MNEHMIKKYIIHLVNSLGVTTLLRKMNRTPIVLFWHGVDSHPNEIVEAESIDAKTFEEEIAYLNKYYEIISMDEFYKRYTDRNFTNREIVITFDDGYRNNLTVAAPILKKYNLPFTIFISTENIESHERFYAALPRLVFIGGGVDEYYSETLQKTFKATSYEERISMAYEIEGILKQLPFDVVQRIKGELLSLMTDSEKEALYKKYPCGEPMTWNEVNTLVSDYNCTIGSHCCEHICCHEEQRKEAIVEQLKKSKEQIELHTGRECKYFSYPNGDYTTYSNSVVKDIYILGFSTNAQSIHVFGDNRAIIPRVIAARDLGKFKILVAYRTNRNVKRIINSPHTIAGKIKKYWRWSLFRISQLGLLNAISPRLRPWFWKKIGVNIKGSCSIGYDVYFDVDNANLITIEDGVWITSRNLLLCHKRDMTDYKRGDDYNKLPYIKKPIVLKKGCAIGMDSVIMPGVTIGEGTVVGTGSLVSHDLPDWCIAIGRPAKVVKQL